VHKESAYLLNFGYQDYVGHEAAHENGTKDTDNFLVTVGR
jgi:hypothetical protein